MSRFAFLALLIAGIAGTSGCEPDITPQLKAELAELKKTRIEIELVARAKQEADQAEADLAQARERAEAAQVAAVKAAAGSGKRAASLRSELEKSAARNTSLLAEMDALSQRQNELAARIEKLGTEKARLQQRARWVRDQTLAFVASYAHEDPSDVVERRDRALGEFMQKVRETFPQMEPKLADTSGERPADSAAMRDELQRLADRFSERYAIDAATPQPVAASGPEAAQRTE